MNKTQFYYSFVFYYITIENGRIFTVLTICNLRSLNTTFSSRPFLWPINHLELPIFYYGSTMFVGSFVRYVCNITELWKSYEIPSSLLPVEKCNAKNQTTYLTTHYNISTMCTTPVSYLYTYTI